MLFRYEVDLNNLKISEKEIEFAKNHQKSLFESFFLTLLGTKNKQGLDPKTATVVHKLLEKLEKSTNGSIDVDLKELNLLQGVFLEDEVRIKPQQIRYFMELRKSLEETVTKLEG